MNSRYLCRNNNLNEKRRDLRHDLKGESRLHVRDELLVHGPFHAHEQFQVRERHDNSYFIRLKQLPPGIREFCAVHAAGADKQRANRGFQHDGGVAECLHLHDDAIRSAEHFFHPGDLFPRGLRGFRGCLHPDFGVERRNEVLELGEFAAVV